MREFLRRSLRPAALVAVAGVVLAPSWVTPALAQGVAEQPAIVATAAPSRAEWSARLWSVANLGKAEDVLAALDAAPNDPSLAETVRALRANVEAREKKRAEQTGKIREELERSLAEEGNDLSISSALRSAVALQMLSGDKKAFLQDEKIKGLVARAATSARAAETRGDWMMASELYYRLNLLVDEMSYKDDVQRERRRLEMIRAYAPQRFWELRNERRNAEIEYVKKHRKPEQTAKAEGESEDDFRPLPPYNPVGDDFRVKLQGVDEIMVARALANAATRHVEQVPWVTVLRDGLEAVRTLVTTDDLVRTFPSLKDERAREAFLRVLRDEDERLQGLKADAGLGDLQRVIDRIAASNEKSIRLPQYVLMHEFGNGGMDALDEFSAIIWPDEIARFQRTTQGHFYGVGVQIEQDPLQNVRVVTPIDGTPAQRAGMRRGDIIRKVDGNSTVGFTLDQAVDNITGPLDTKVKLTIEREVTGDDGKPTSKELEFELVRKQIPVHTVRGWKRNGPHEADWDWFIDSTRKVGYVRLSQFAEPTAEDLRAAIDRMKQDGVRGVILDLRFNPGGLLDKAVEIANRFIEPTRNNQFADVIVSTHKKNGDVVEAQRAKRGEATLAGIPIAVLINEGSASASEIVSGAIQDYARAGLVKAIVIGQRSYGKGSVQNVWPLPITGAQAAIKVTTNYYHLPGGRLIHRRPGATVWGVEPDLAVEMLPEQVVEALRQRANADVILEDGTQPKIGADAKPEERATDTGNPLAGPDLQLQFALVLLQSQVDAPERALSEKSGERPAQP